jgi:hypothetical protein
MARENKMISESKQNDLDIARESVYDKCGFTFANLIISDEGREYQACSFELNGLKIQYRASKITPTKAGQFVTVWKRDADGITTPFHISDNIDFIIVTSRSDGSLGQFIFPMDALADNNVITRNGKEGKRGIRVYPPWDIAPNKQAEKTQRWQLKYFLPIPLDNTINLAFAKELLKKPVL